MQESVGYVAKVECPVAKKEGFSDGLFKRPMNNTFPPYTDRWHAYNAAYIDGHTRNINTANLAGDEA